MSIETIEKTEKEGIRAKIIKANHVLKAKIGMGPLDVKAVARAQSVIDNNSYDFAPMALHYLTKLADAINETRDGKIAQDIATGRMSEIVMQLKANSPIFKYRLIGNLASLMLGFLESIDKIDNDVLDIVDAHHKTLRVIVSKKLEGDGGAMGEKLQQELKDAIRRYTEKKSHANLS
jgi:hypothetical protein